MDYPTVLRAIMKIGRYKQAGLAERLKVEQPTVSRWLKGAKPKIDQHERIVAEAQRRFGLVVVKRLQVLRRGEPPTIRIISDNEAHDPEDVGPDEIEIVGRVICGLRRF